MSKVRMIEVFKGKINHYFADGLYIHSGDLLEALENDRQACEEATDFSGQELFEELIARWQAMILSRKGGE